MEGYRTYIVAGLLAINSVLFGFGLIDRSTYETIWGLLTGTGFMTLRAGIKKDTAEVKKIVAPPQVIMP